MLLAVDAGNTHIKFAVFEGSAPTQQWRLRMVAERTADEYAAILLPLFGQAGVAPMDIRDIAVACVVPAALQPLTRALEHVCHRSPLLITGSAKTGLCVAYEPPDAVGADRVADAVAATAIYGAPCIVIDFGTATTFNAVTAAATDDGMPVYRGGAICLGIGVSLDALFAKAAKIPTVALASPPQAIGSNTTHALQSGIVHGYAAMVDGMVARFRAEMGAPNCPVVATGGYAELIAAQTRTITAVEPLLTLHGLRIAAEHPRLA